MELYVDGTLDQVFALRDDYTFNNYAKWEGKWTVLPSTHTIKILLTGANGLTDEKEFCHTATHIHRFDPASVQLSSTVVIRDDGILAQSATCAICGQSVNNISINPAEAIPGIAGFGNGQMVINGNLNNKNLDIQLDKTNIVITNNATVSLHSIKTNRNVQIAYGSNLQAETINCNELKSDGGIHSGSVASQSVIIGSSGKLTMNAGDSIHTNTFEFGSSINHSALITGGELTITGNMITKTPLYLGNDHKTIFTAGTHLLENSHALHFGILVSECALGNLGAKNSFTYKYLVLPAVDESQHTTPSAPEVPEKLRPYLDKNNHLTETSLEDKLRDEQYSARIGSKFTHDSFVQGTYFTIMKLSDEASIPGSLENAILQMAAMNAIADFAATNGDSILSKMLGVGKIEFRDDGYYDVRINNTYQRFYYDALVTSDLAVGNAGGATAMELKIEYTEHTTLTDGTEVRVFNTFKLIPTPAYNNMSVTQLMKKLKWEGKNYVDETVNEMKVDILKDYALFAIEMSGFDGATEVANTIRTIDEVSGMTSNQTENLPLLQVYTDTGVMRVYSDQLTGNLPFSDLCEVSHDTILSSLVDK